jgi:hypothetical protein
MDADTFYYTLDGTEYGPYKRERLQKWVNAGHFDDRGACSVRSVLTGVVYDLGDILDNFGDWFRAMSQGGPSASPPKLGTTERVDASSTGALDHSRSAPPSTAPHAPATLRRPSTAPPGCGPDITTREATATSSSVAVPYAYDAAEYPKPAPPPGTVASPQTHLPVHLASATREEEGSASAALREAHDLIKSLDASYGVVGASGGSIGAAGGGADVSPRHTESVGSTPQPRRTTAGNVRVNRHGSIDIFSGVRFGDLQAELASLRPASRAPPAAMLTPMPSAIDPRILAAAAHSTNGRDVPGTAYDLPTLVFASLESDVPALDTGAILTESQKLDPALRPGLVFRSSADDATERADERDRLDSGLNIGGRGHPSPTTPARIPPPRGAVDDRAAATPAVPRPTAYARDWSKMRAMFEHADRSGDGEICVRELMLALRHDTQLAMLLHLPAHIHQEDGTRAAFERVFAVFDEDDSRSITWDEFLAHIMDWADWTDDDDDDEEEEEEAVEEEEEEDGARARSTSMYHREIAAALPLPTVDADKDEGTAVSVGLDAGALRRGAGPPPGNNHGSATVVASPATLPGTSPHAQEQDAVTPRVSINRHGSISIVVGVPRRSASQGASAPPPIDVGLPPGRDNRLARTPSPRVARAHASASSSGANAARDHPLACGTPKSNAANLDIALRIADVPTAARSSTPVGVERRGNGIEGVLLKKGRIGFQQRFFRLHKHYLAFSCLSNADDSAFEGGVDLAGPSTSIALSTDMKTLTVIGVGIDAAADEDHATAKRERTLCTLTLRASKSSPTPTLTVWAAQLRATALASSTESDVDADVEETAGADVEAAINAGGGDGDAAAAATGLASIFNSAQDAVYGAPAPVVPSASVSAKEADSDPEEHDVVGPMNAEEQLVSAVALLQQLLSAPTAALREASVELLERIAVLRETFADSCAEAELRESTDPRALGVLAASLSARRSALLSGDSSPRPDTTPSHTSDVTRERHEFSGSAMAILAEARALHRRAGADASQPFAAGVTTRSEALDTTTHQQEQGIGGPLLKKGRIGFQQRYFMKVSHYLLYRNSESATGYAGGVDLAGPQSSVAFSDDRKTLTVVGRDAAAQGERSERALRTLTLREPARAPKHSLAQWADELRTSIAALSVATAALHGASGRAALGDIDGALFVAEVWADECGVGCEPEKN